MKLKNLTNYGDLQVYWRFQLKQALPNGRKTIYWRNDGGNFVFSSNDIVHYWGAQSDIAKGNYLFYFSRGKLNSTIDLISIWLALSQQGTRKYLAQYYCRKLQCLETNLLKFHSFSEWSRSKPYIRSWSMPLGRSFQWRYTLKQSLDKSISFRNKSMDLEDSFHDRTGAIFSPNPAISLYNERGSISNNELILRI